MKLRTATGETLDATIADFYGMPTLYVDGEPLVYHEHVVLVDATRDEREQLDRGGYDIPDATP